MDGGGRQRLGDPGLDVLVGANRFDSAGGQGRIDFVDQGAESRVEAFARLRQIT